VDKTAVGMTLVSIPALDRIGSATVREHLPKQDISWIAATLFCLGILYTPILRFVVI
jgi:hypothetical protein